MLTKILQGLKSIESFQQAGSSLDALKNLQENTLIDLKKPDLPTENPEYSSSWNVLRWLQLKLICTTAAYQDPENNFSEKAKFAYTNLDGAKQFLENATNLTNDPESLQKQIDARYEILLTEYIAYELSLFTFSKRKIFSAQELLSKALAEFKKRLLKESLLHFENIYAKEHSITIEGRFDANSPIQNHDFAMDQMGVLHQHLADEDQTIPLMDTLDSFLKEHADEKCYLGTMCLGTVAEVFNTLETERFISIKTYLDEFSASFEQLAQKAKDVLQPSPSQEEKKSEANLTPPMQQQPSPLETTKIKKMFELMLNYPFISGVAVGIIIAGTMAGIMYASNLPVDTSLGTGGFFGAALTPLLIACFSASGNTEPLAPPGESTWFFVP